MSSLAFPLCLPRGLYVLQMFYSLFIDFNVTNNRKGTRPIFAKFSPLLDGHIGADDQTDSRLAIAQRMLLW